MDVYQWPLDLACARQTLASKSVIWTHAIVQRMTVFDEERSTSQNARPVGNEREMLMAFDMRQWFATTGNDLRKCELRRSPLRIPGT